MRTIDELLSDLSRQGLRLWVEGDSLCYNAPHQSLIADNMAELRERQKEIRDYLEQTGAYSSLSSLIPRASRERTFPLSVAQEGFWSLEQAIPGNWFSNVFSAFRLSGPLDTAALQRTFDEIVRRHEALRTTFAMTEGHPAQIISSVLPLQVALENVSALPETEREAACLRHIFQEAHKPFDLTNGPLLRVVLLRVSDVQHLLLITMHHIISDIWSLHVLVDEVAQLYEALVHRLPPPLPEPSIHYADYTVWQHGLLRGGGLNAQLSYWMNKLDDGHLPLFRLPTDYPRPESPCFDTSRKFIALDKPLYDALRNAGHKQGCTVFMTLTALLNIVLFSFTGRGDIRLGTLTASRNHSQLEAMLGLFINTLLLRTNLSDDPTTRDVLQRTRDTVLEAYDNQDLPFETLLQALEREHSCERSSLFPVLFLFGNMPLPDLKMSDVTLQTLDVGNGMLEATLDVNTVTSFDLIITLTEGPVGVTGALVYKNALFSAATIDRLLEHFYDVAGYIATQPDTRLSALPPLPGQTTEMRRS